MALAAEPLRNRFALERERFPDRGITPLVRENGRNGGQGLDRRPEEGRMGSGAFDCGFALRFPDRRCHVTLLADCDHIRNQLLPEAL
jgi:hypothetical protein